ncbi:MAG: hypothetical protein VW122_12215, partial [Paracoccaceae bacterium]
MNDPSKDAVRFDNPFVAKGQTMALTVKISMCLHNRIGLFCFNLVPAIFIFRPSLQEGGFA